jgi:hypothetical protein
VSIKPFIRILASPLRTRPGAIAADFLGSFLHDAKEPMSRFSFAAMALIFSGFPSRREYSFPLFGFDDGSQNGVVLGSRNGCNGHFAL